MQKRCLLRDPFVYSPPVFLPLKAISTLQPKGDELVMYTDVKGTYKTKRDAAAAKTSALEAIDLRRFSEVVPDHEFAFPEKKGATTKVYYVRPEDSASDMSEGAFHLVTTGAGKLISYAIQAANTVQNPCASVLSIQRTHGAGGLVAMVRHSSP